MADPAYSNTGQPLPAPSQYLKGQSGGGGKAADRKLFPPIAGNGSTKGSPVSGSGSCPPTASSSPNPLPDIGGGGSGEGVRTSLTGTPLTTTSSRTSLHQLPPQSPTKLPTIAKKSSSISNLAALTGSVRRTTSLPTAGMRADLCRSPSCPQLWTGDLDDEEEGREEEVEYRDLQKGVSLDSRAMRSSRTPHKNLDSPTKLPSIFGGSSTTASPSRLKSSIRRSTSLQSNLRSSLVDAPNIAGVGRALPRLARENSTMTSSLSLSMTDAGFRERQGVSPARRLNNTTALLLPMRENADSKKLKRAGSKKRVTNAAVGNAPAATPGARQASEGTSGDSGVSVNYRQTSDHSDSSSTAQDGSETGVWEPEVEVEIDDETPEGRLRAQMEGGSTPRVTPSSNKGNNRKGEVVGAGGADRDPDVGDHRTALSAEKCREWLENVSEDGQTKTKASTKGKRAFKMPKIN